MKVRTWKEAEMAVAEKYIVASAIVAVGAISAPLEAFADEGGVSFWLPGQYGSLAALPQVPGWQFATIYYHTSVSAAANAKFPIGQGDIQVGLDGDANLGVLVPAYVFADPVLGGQATVSLAGIYGTSTTGVDATITGPNGGTISGHKEDTRWGWGDLYPTASLRWNKGVNNFMIYGTGDIPVGAYDPSRLANIGIGHGAIDGGAAYTYFNPQSGLEFSVLAGLTYNFENQDTDYQNGIDSHIDWGASKFLTPYSRSASPAISSGSLPATAARVQSSAISNRRSPASARRSAICFRPATSKATSI